MKNKNDFTNIGTRFENYVMKNYNCPDCNGTLFDLEEKHVSGHSSYPAMDLGCKKCDNKINAKHERILHARKSTPQSKTALDFLLTTTEPHKLFMAFGNERQGVIFKRLSDATQVKRCDRLRPPAGITTKKARQLGLGKIQKRVCYIF
tara:strand:+ start:296 stop:739 length:444 start_codon:yes stop_codon:yes gene_type:complete